MLSLTALGYFNTKIDVAISQSIDDRNPYVALIEIHNAGEFNMYNATISVKVDSIIIENSKDKSISRGAYNGVFSDENPMFKKSSIESNEYWTTSIPLGVLYYTYEPGFRLRDGDITVTLNYNYLWRKNEKKFRFYGVSDNEGKVVWTKQPKQQRLLKTP